MVNNGDGGDVDTFVNVTVASAVFPFVVSVIGQAVVWLLGGQMYSVVAPEMYENDALPVGAPAVTVTLTDTGTVGILGLGRGRGSPLNVPVPCASASPQERKANTGRKIARKRMARTLNLLILNSPSATKAGPSTSTE